MDAESFLAAINEDRPFTTLERAKLTGLIEMMAHDQRRMMVEYDKMQRMDKWMTWGLYAQCFLVGWVFGKLWS
jgi:hypothetical protein